MPDAERTIVAKLTEVADSLDAKGHEQQAEMIDSVIKRFSSNILLMAFIKKIMEALGLKAFPDIQTQRESWGDTYIFSAPPFLFTGEQVRVDFSEHESAPQEAEGDMLSWKVGAPHKDQVSLKDAEAIADVFNDPFIARFMTYELDLSEIGTPSEGADLLEQPPALDPGTSTAIASVKLSHRA